MKNTSLFFITFLTLIVISATSYAQGDKTLRPSPPAEASGMIDSVKVTINYSSPSVKGRGIWGGLVPYNQVWRTGANEATIFETNKDLTINGQKLPAGKYGLFTIPGEKVWTIIFNSVWDQWGAFKYDSGKDVLRIIAPSETSREFHEHMLFEIKGHDVILSWENLLVKFEVKG
ncbi:MAG TPA: DUF2911 domain-containing protein [Saprospiraceae bacterium]|nr:DUF2911 domain-containing protein [Saprospiraceae bacterium]